MGEQCGESLGMQNVMPIMPIVPVTPIASTVVERDRREPLCAEPMEHHLAPLGIPIPPVPRANLHPLSFKKGVFPSLNPQPKGRAQHCPGGEDLHDGWLGAQAVGLVVLHHEAAGQLPGGVGEAAGGRRVGANCEGQRWSSAVARGGEQGQRGGTVDPRVLGVGRTWRRKRKDEVFLLLPLILSFLGSP